MAENMDVADSTNNGFPTEVMSKFNQSMAEELIYGFKHCNDKTTVETLKYRLLDELLRGWQMSFKHIAQLLKTHTPVHGAIRGQLMEKLPHNSDFQHALVQDFIKNETLHKIFNTLCKGGFKNIVHAYLAMDGLRGTKLVQNPNYDMKRYFDNLRINLCGTYSMYDNEIDAALRLRLRHVHAVRKVYQKLFEISAKDDTTPLSQKVYLVIRRVLKDIQTKNQKENGKLELKLPEEKGVKMDEADILLCVKEYLHYMEPETFQMYMLEQYNIDISLSESDDSSDDSELEEEEEDTPCAKINSEPSKKRKRKTEEDNIEGNNKKTKAENSKQSSPEGSSKQTKPEGNSKQSKTEGNSKLSKMEEKANNR